MKTLKTVDSYVSLASKTKVKGRNGRMLVSMDYGKSHIVSPLKRTMENSHNSSGTVLGIQTLGLKSKDSRLDDPHHKNQTALKGGNLNTIDYQIEPGSSNPNKVRFFSNESRDNSLDDTETMEGWDK